MKSGQSYMDRAMRSPDPRFAQVLEKLGYARRDIRSAAPVVIGDGYPPEDEMRSFIEAATGEKLHHRTGRLKIIEAYDAALTAKDMDNGEDS